MPQASRAAFVILFCSVLLSIVVSPWPGESALKAAPLLLGLALYVAIAQGAPSKSRNSLLFSGLILVSLGLSLIAPLGMALSSQIKGSPPFPESGQILPDGLNANVVAGALVVLWPFGVARALAASPRNAWQWIMVCGAIAASGLSLGTVAISGSYAGAISATLGALALVVACWPRIKRRGRAALGIPLALSIPTLGWALISGWRPPSAIVETLRERAEIWSRALMIVRAFPLTGIGFGSFEAYVGQLMPLLASGRQTVSHAHSLYLQIAVDLGLLGLSAFLVLLATSVLSSVRLARSDRHTPEQDSAFLAGACLASLAGICVHGLVDAAVWGNKGAFLPWIVMGLSSALSRERDLLQAARRSGDHAHDN